MPDVRSFTFNVTGTLPEKGTRAYVCGPMTGIEEYNYPAFFAAKEVLEALGLAPSIPPELTPYHPDTVYGDYLKADIEGMLKCDILILLPGWHLSRGALVEVTLAGTMGMGIWFIDLENRLFLDMSVATSPKISLYRVDLWDTAKTSIPEPSGISSP